MEAPDNRGSRRESIIVPQGILATFNGTNRRSYQALAERTEPHGRRLVRSMFFGSTDQPNEPSQEAPTLDTLPPETVAESAEEEEIQPSHHPSAGSEEPQSAAVDFAQVAGQDFAQVAEQDFGQVASQDFAAATRSQKRQTKLTFPSDSKDETPEGDPSAKRSSTFFNRLSYVARGFGPPTRQDRPSVSGSFVGDDKIDEDQSTDTSTNRSSTIFNRLSYIARGSLGDETTEENPSARRSANRSSTIFNRLSYIPWAFGAGRQERPSVGSHNRRTARQSILSRFTLDSYDAEGDAVTKRMRRRDSKAVPKSWKFLGIDAPDVGEAVSNVKSNFRGMYETAKVKQDKIRRSDTGQLIFKYAFYVVMVATVYFVLVGLPLWRGLVWYMYILFEKHLVLKAGLTITIGLGFMYAYLPLLINFEKTAPIPESQADESGRAIAHDGDTALIIPCYKSANLIGPTLEAALKIFPKKNIFVVANGNSPEPLDNTADVCKEYDVSHTWSPMGSKIIAQFVGCYVARKFPYVLLIDDDCALPPNLPIVSDRFRGNIKCIGYIMKVVGENGSRGTMCQQAQDLEYKLSGLAKAFAGKVGSVTFPHGCIVLWDRDLLVKTFQEHPGFSVSEDWFFGHAARQLGSRITMCTSTFVETETPTHIFSTSGGARGGFGEMTVWKQRFYRWNYFFVTGMYYDLIYILFDWKLGWWEIGAKIFVFQEIYETLLYLLAPFVIPISFATRPGFAAEIYIATIVMYIFNALIFNYVHLRSRNESVTFKAFCYYVPFKWVLGFINIASCYYAIYTYATYFAKRHPKVIEDDQAVEIVLKMEEQETHVSEKGEISDMNELMYKIAKPITTGGGKRQSVIMTRTVPAGIDKLW